ncbi:MAG: endo-1,3-alpha-glucanase family glycosylhydrolase [Chloroflexia bacterium]
MFSILPWGSSPSAGAMSLSQSGDKLVLAFYYAWYSPADFGKGQMPDTPANPYDSNRPETIEWQVREAAGVGIDGFIASWSGLDTPSDTNFAKLLDIAARYNFKATVYFETDSVARQGDVAGQLKGLMSKYANHPAFLKWAGKPVVFFWRPQAVGGAAQWRAVRSAVDPSNGQVWSVDTTDISYLDVFDTIHFYSAGKWQANTNAGQVHKQWRATVDNYNKQHGTRRLWVAGVIPGWDESRVQPPRQNAKVFPRGDGSLYNEMWKGATASNPEWITITSYNEWFEGTQIEPAQSYGTRYLDLTKQHITSWKGVAPQPISNLDGSNSCAGGVLFPETQLAICKAMEDYWRSYGGLQQFGYPISTPVNEKSALDSKSYLVQYFERAVFELHLENKPPYDVMLSQLGTLQYRKTYPGGAPNQRQNHEAGKLFPETGKWVGGAFLQRWEKNGGVFVNGYPITDEFEEKLSDGKTYTVQYFERARFEFHPENAAPYNVLLGALGRLAWEGQGGR